MTRACSECGWGVGAAESLYCESCRRHAEARARAVMHAASTGDVVVGNLKADGEWHLVAIAQPVNDPEPSPPPPPAPVTPSPWYARLWRWVSR